MSYSPRNLDGLEAEAIHVIREVAAEFENPVLPYSIGKDRCACCMSPARPSRQGRLIDKDEAGSMERKKREGYF